MRMKVGFLIIATVTSASVLADSFADQINIRNTMYLAAACNRSDDKVIIENKQRQLYVPAHNNTRFTNGFIIPFVSINSYMKQFVKNIPYTPENALKIKTSLGLFCLWLTESGLICAPDPKDISITIDEWKMRMLLTPTNTAKFLKLLLLIDKQGNIDVKNVHQSLS